MMKDKNNEVAERLDRSYAEQTKEFMKIIGAERAHEIAPAMEARYQLAAEIGTDSIKLGAGFQMINAGIVRIPCLWDGDAGLREIELGLKAIEEATATIRGRVTVARTRGAVINV